MPNITPNYKLEKPNPEEFYDVAVPNTNMDKIDVALKALADAILDGVTQQDLSAISNKLTEHLEEIMPHKFLDNGKWYRWGFRTVDGEPEFIYEEVV